MITDIRFDLEVKRSGVISLRRVAADISLPAWVVIDTSLGVTRFIPACFIENATLRKRRFMDIIRPTAREIAPKIRCISGFGLVNIFLLEGAL